MIRKRLAGNFAANLFTQGVNTLWQLGSVALFLACWSKERYGEWLLISSIPTYLSLGEGGFATVVANEVAMFVADNKTAEARRSLHTACGFLGAISLLLALLACLGAWLVPWVDLLHLTSERQQIPWTMLLLAIYTIIGLALSISGAVYRAAYKLARVTFITSVGRLLELLAVGGVLVYSGRFIVLALALTLVRISTAAFIYWDGIRVSPGLRLGFAEFSFAELQRTWRPAILFMAFPLGNALYFQGLTLLVGRHLGAAAVVTFNTTRALTRALVQMVTIIKHSAWPEYSYLFGARDLDRARRLSGLTFEVTLLLLTGFGLGLFFAGAWIMSLWTHGAVQLSSLLLALFLVSAVLNGLWNVSAGLLMGVNGHNRLALVYLAATAGSVLLGQALIAGMGLPGVAVAMIVAEAAMLPYTIWRSCRLLEQPVGAFLLGTLTLQQMRAFAASLRAQKVKAANP